jgi:hypothetical protein
MDAETKPIVAAILNFLVPGLGNLIIESKYTMHYFAGFIITWLVTVIVGFATLGLCFPIFLLPFIWCCVAAYDVFYEAKGKDDKRLLKQYIH